VQRFVSRADYPYHEVQQRELLNGHDPDTPSCNRSSTLQGANEL